MPVLLRRSRRLLLTLLLAAVLLPAAQAQDTPAPSDAVPVFEPAPGAFSATLSRYTCDPQACRLPFCQCAQVAPPAGIAPAEAPQFLLITVDDCVNKATDDEVQSLIDGTLKNPDGRPVPLTYFLSLEGCAEGGRTDAALVRERYRVGNEIAVHTRTHTTYDTTRAEVWRDEIQSVRDFIAANDVGRGVGFRAPRTATNPALFETLRNLNFLYDSSLYESPYYSPVSQGLNGFLWPYTFDSWGPRYEDRAQNCEQFVVENKCATQPQPGLWEIPLYYYVTSEAPPDNKFLGAFDVGNPVYNTGSPALTADSLARVLTAHFEARYTGNRAPLNLYFHSPTLGNIPLRDAYRGVIADALARPAKDVWAVTMQGLIEWMQAPVPNAGMTAWYNAYCRRHTCTLRGTAAEAAPVEAEAALRVFPNPATTTATAEVHPEAPGAVVTVHGVMGRELRRHVLGAAGPQHVTLDLSGLAAGLYLVRVTDGPRTQTHKLVRH